MVRATWQASDPKPYLRVSSCVHSKAKKLARLQPFKKTISFFFSILHLLAKVSVSNFLSPYKVHLMSSTSPTFFKNNLLLTGIVTICIGNGMNASSFRDLWARVMSLIAQFENFQNIMSDHKSYELTYIHYICM